MRDYVKINGTSSLTITGLAISKLPAITKPLIRTQIEEIDGRDGDIITKLGYSAYDKELEIGLYGNFNIDNVIKFFNSSGKIIFSNENDKYYNFEILEQIDFEKLLKFKTAAVNIHIQPFKYPVNETAVSLSVGNNTITNGGNVYSKPTLKIKGTGTIGVSLGGTQIFSIDLGESETEIVIDTTNMEAYNSTTTDLMNRQVTGDYSLFKLAVGNNTIALSGTITTASISGYTRWL